MEIKPTPPPKEIMQPLKINGDRQKRNNNTKENSRNNEEGKKEKVVKPSKQGENVDFFA